MSLRQLLRSLAGLLLGLMALLGTAYVLMPDPLGLWALQIERDRAGLTRHEVNVDGQHWIYLDGGKGPPLVLLHGLGADKDHWTRVARGLGAHYRIIAPDLPGFGESPPPPDQRYDIATQTQRLADFIAALRLEQPDLGGSSMGGWIAARYTAIHADSVHSLWLLAPGGVTASMQRSELAARLKAGKPNPLFAETPAHFKDVMRFVFVHPPYVPGAVARLLAKRQAENHARNLQIFQQLRTETLSLDQAVAGLATPTLIIWGAGDRVQHPVGGDMLHRVLPRSQLIVMPDVGHLPMIEAPQASAADYLRFRDTLAADTPR